MYARQRTQRSEEPSCPEPPRQRAGSTSGTGAPDAGASGVTCTVSGTTNLFINSGFVGTPYIVERTNCGAAQPSSRICDAWTSREEGGTRYDIVFVGGCSVRAANSAHGNSERSGRGIWVGSIRERDPDVLRLDDVLPGDERARIFCGVFFRGTGIGSSGNCCA